MSYSATDNLLHCGNCNARKLELIEDSTKVSSLSVNNRELEKLQCRAKLVEILSRSCSKCMQVVLKRIEEIQKLLSDHRNKQTLWLAEFRISCEFSTLFKYWLLCSNKLNFYLTFKFIFKGSLSIIQLINCRIFKI